MITYGSVCSGIEAATTAWHPLGWSPRWFAEIEPFPSAVLAHHWPEVPNLGDFALIRDKIAEGGIDAPDILVGGTPCQAFSIAGLRQSLDDKRGQLTIEFVRLADAIDSARSFRGQRPVTVVWENVPGVLTTPDNAFGCFLAGLVGEDDPLEPPGGRWTNAGYVRGPRRAVAWRILDAQYFGVAQRRRRVFLVASAGGIRPEQVLFELDGVRRDSPPRREAGQGFAPAAGTLAANGGGTGRGSGAAVAHVEILPTGEIGAEPVSDLERAHRRAHNMGSLAMDGKMGAAVYGLDEEQNPTRDFFGTLKARTKGGGFEGSVAIPGMPVRHLTPTECERLQGFPDGHTLIPWRGKGAEGCPDGPRYKALGNSMAVPVMRWIGMRLDAALRECQP